MSKSQIWQAKHKSSVCDISYLRIFGKIYALYEMNTLWDVFRKNYGIHEYLSIFNVCKEFIQNFHKKCFHIHVRCCVEGNNFCRNIDTQSWEFETFLNGVSSSDTFFREYHFRILEFALNAK